MCNFSVFSRLALLLLIVLKILPQKSALSPTKTDDAKSSDTKADIPVGKCTQNAFIVVAGPDDPFSYETAIVVGSVVSLGMLEPSLAIPIIPSLFSYPRWDFGVRVFCLFLFIISSFRAPIASVPAPGSPFWYLEMLILAPFLKFFELSLALSIVIPVGLLMLLPIPAVLHVAVVNLLTHSGYSSLGDVFWNAIIIPLILLDDIPLPPLFLMVLTMVSIPPLAYGWLADEILSANPYFASTLVLSSLRFILALYLLRRELS